VLHRNVHVEVLDGDIEFTDTLLVFLTPDVQLIADLLESSDLLGVLCNAFSILSNFPNTTSRLKMVTIVLFNKTPLYYEVE
jgi:hypothetical protein